MIIYNNNTYTKTIFSPSSCSAKKNKYQDHIGFGHNNSKSVKVKTSSKKQSKRKCTKKPKLTKKNITYLKSLGLKLKEK